MNGMLEVHALQQRYGDVQALADITFTIQKGEIVCILGPSGCGKSTLLQLVAGLQPPYRGEIRIDGTVVATNGYLLPPERRQVNMVFQDYALWPHMNVFDNIAYGLRRQKKTRAEIQDRVNHLLSLLRLDGLAHRLPSHLSGGQQQRVGIARAIATNPSLLLMDEPLSNLDMQLRMEMRNELSFLLRQLGMTVLYVTHDTAEAFALADRIMILRSGAIEQFDTPQRIFRYPASEWSAQLMGYTNKLSAHDKVHSHPGALWSTEVAGSTVSGTLLSARHDGQLRQLNIFFHPDHATLTGPQSSSTNETNVIRGRVKYSVFEGIQWRNWIEISGENIVSVPSSNPLTPHDMVHVQFPTQSTFFYAEPFVAAP